MNLQYSYMVLVTSIGRFDQTPSLPPGYRSGSFALVEFPCCPAIECVQETTEQIEHSGLHRVIGHVVERNQGQHNATIACGRGKTLTYPLLSAAVE